MFYHMIDMDPGRTNTNVCTGKLTCRFFFLPSIYPSFAPHLSDRIFDLRCQPPPSIPPSVSLSAASIPPPPPPVSDVTIILKKRRRGVGRPAAEPTRERTGEEWSGSCRRRRRSKMLQGALVNVFMSHISNGMIQWFAEPESNLPLTCFTQLCKFMIMINHGSLRTPWLTMSESCV